MADAADVAEAAEVADPADAADPSDPTAAADAADAAEAADPADAAQVIVVMGVSGSGKSTVAEGIARITGWDFAEGDTFHSEANVEKMRSGQALSDDDRRPWLEAIAAWITAQQQRGASAVVTCSALRRSYRDLLRRDRQGLRFLHVTADPRAATRWMESRGDHYMPASLLASQLAALEPLEPDEPGVEVENDGTTDEVLDRALHALGLRREQPA